MDFLTWRKAELHCHLDGAVRASTAAELGAFGRPPRMVAPDDCKSQAEYIGYFDDAIAVMQTQAALERIAYEVCADSAAENIDYLEVRWAPRLHLRGGLTVPQVIEGVLAGLAAGPMRAVAIVCAMRQHSVEDNVALAREAGRYAGRGVVGFDLAGDEIRYPVGPQRPAFEAARASGLRLTCHAGEAGEPASVEEALDFGIERGDVVEEAALRASIEGSLGDLDRLLTGMPPDALAMALVYRRKDGERQLTLGEFIDQFLVGHLEEHLVQLEELT